LISVSIGNPHAERNNDAVLIDGVVVHQSAKAYKFAAADRTVWLPSSVCEWHEHDKQMQMPEWLAKDKGLI
jgi:hypothetical protein